MVAALARPTPVCARGESCADLADEYEQCKRAEQRRNAKHQAFLDSEAIPKTAAPLVMKGAFPYGDLVFATRKEVVEEGGIVTLDVGASVDGEEPSSRSTSCSAP